MPTFHWDFRGAQAPPRALHFMGHLKQTLGDWSLELSPVLKAYEPTHHVIELELTFEQEDQLRSTIKPNRITDD